MGDRVKVICKNVYGASPAVYAHGLGHDAQEIITEAWPNMRHGDASYASAALCAHFVKRATYAYAPHEISVGLYPPPKSMAPEFLASPDYNCGDAGVFVVDVDTGVVTIFGGYLTGQGVGALGLSEADDLEMQRAWGDAIVFALNAFTGNTETNIALRDADFERKHGILPASSRGEEEGGQ